MASARVSKQFLMTNLALALLCLWGGLLLFKRPYVASNLDLVPDSVEYAIGAWRLATHGSYDLMIGGASHPPRYVPWFSCLLAPFIALGGGEVGYAIIPVFLCALGALAGAFMLGREVSGLWGGYLAGTALLAVPFFRFFSRYVMTDVPSVCVMLWGAFVFIRLRRDGVTPWRLLMAGLLVALSVALRRTTIFMLLPFALVALSSDWRTSLRRLALLGAPLAVVMIATAVYNIAVFGSPTRDGYNYWCAVPFDVGLTFSCVFVPANVHTMFGTTTLVLLGACIVFSVLAIALNRRNGQVMCQLPALRAAVEFGCFILIPLTAMHLFYFCDDPRFALPLQTFTATLAGALAGGWLERLGSRILLVTGVALVLIGVAWRMEASEYVPHRRIAVEAIMRDTPPDAVVISAIDPAYFTAFTGMAKRLVIPLHRRVEYASKLVSPRKPGHLEPGPVSAWDHRCPGLLAYGATDVVQFTADEGLARIADYLRDGKVVYLDTGFVFDRDGAAVALIRDTFNLVNVSRSVYRLERSVKSQK